MKQLLLFMMLCTVGHGLIVAQTGEKTTTAFQFGFVPPLSTNGLQAHKYTNGASFHILAGVSKNEKAFTFASLSNIILNDANGFQFAGLSNYVGNDGKGMLFSSLANITKSHYDGFQLTGLVNYAKKMSGFQFSGLANIAGDIKGFQFAGLINIARNVSGVQFAGLLNIAESSTCPIGLVNIIKNGEMGVAITYNETGSTMVTFRSGGDITYGIIGLGYNHQTSGRASYVTEAGFGAHINCLSWLRIHQELKTSVIGNTTANPTFVANYFVLPAFKVTPYLEIFGGPGLNYMNMKNTSDRGLLPSHSIWKNDGSSRLQRIFIGYQAGIQYLF